MPFHVIYSEFSRQAGLINSFTAGADQIAVCDLAINLTATVDGDLFGHTTLWEQISGTSITFVTPVANELSVDYINGSGSPIAGGVFDDKVFRFWIDKGSVDPSNPEQFDDINIFATPTSTSYNSVSIIGISKGYRECNVPSCQQTSIGLPYGTVGAECGVSTGTIFWNTPACEDIEVVQYEIEEYTPGAGYAIVATLSPTIRRFDGPVSGRSYKLITTLINGSVDVGCIKWFNDQTIFGQEQSFHKMSDIGGGVIVSNYEVLTRTVINCFDAKLDLENNESYHGVGAAGNGVTISNYNVLERSLINCLDPQITEANNESYHKTTTFGGVVVSNFHSIVQTGGQIGG